MLQVIAFASIGFISISRSQECRDADFDGFFVGENCASAADCNDQVQNMHPGALELCNGSDDDCDGELDEGCDRSCDALQITTRSTVRQLAYSPSIANAERGWIIAMGDGDGLGNTYPQRVARTDRSGTLVVPSYEFVRLPQLQSPHVTWSGRAIYASWDLAASAPPDGVYIRRLGGWGPPDTEAVRVIDGPSSFEHIAWQGKSLAALWLRGGTSPTNGASLFNESLSQLGNPNEQPWTPGYNPRWAWSGVGFGKVYARQSAATGHYELYFQRLDADGTVLVPEKLITNHQAFAPDAGADVPQIASRGPGQGFGVGWRDTRSYPWQIWFEVIDDQGNVLPPGAIRVSNAVIATVPQRFALVWSGLEFLLVWTNADQSQFTTGKLIAARISSSGALIENRQLTSGPADNEPDAAWDGRRYGVVFNHYSPLANRNDVDYITVACSCTTDADGDGRLPCAGGDCDDSNPNVAPGRAEICNDGVDNDCDGSADCFDSECTQSGTVPGDVVGLTMGLDRQAVIWPPVPGADSYDVLRGVLSDLQALGTVSWALCQSRRQTSTTWVDGSTPFASDGYYYIVRARGLGCLRGTWGSVARDANARECP